MKDHSDALEDVMHSMKLAIEFTDDTNFSDFKRDEKTQYAVIRCLEMKNQKFPGKLWQVCGIV